MNRLKSGDIIKAKHKIFGGIMYIKVVEIYQNVKHGFYLIHTINLNEKHTMEYYTDNEIEIIEIYNKKGEL